MLKLTNEAKTLSQEAQAKLDEKASASRSSENASVLQAIESLIENSAEKKFIFSAKQLFNQSSKHKTFVYNLVNKSEKLAKLCEKQKNNLCKIIKDESDPIHAFETLIFYKK
jgi:hypothetical protein